MPSSFADIRKTNFYNVMLNEQHFAEQVTIRSDGEPDRLVTVVFRRVTAEQASELVDEDVDTGTVCCGRDEAHEKGGIAQPKRGLQLIRANDPAPYAFDGTVLNETAYSWHLQFKRPKLTTIGKR